jgi:peptide chain release factor 1
MTSISSERIASIEARKQELSDAMSAPDLSREEFVRLSKEYSAIEPVAAARASRGIIKLRLRRGREGGAAHALIIGDDELAKGEGQLKNLGSGEQRPVALQGLAVALKA